MNVEKLIAKGVEKHFDGQKVLFKVASLKEHFEGLLIHDTDIVEIEEVAYVSAEDVGFDNATTNEIHPKFEEVSESTLEIEVTQEILDMNPELVDEGIVVGEILTVDSEPITTISSTIIPERIVKAEYQEKTPYEEIEVIEPEIVTPETEE